ncbi:MAG: hypothetical protein ACLSG5_16645 [Oscillospiraceae bacterium]
MDLLLKNGYVVDSASGFEGKADILIHDKPDTRGREDISRRRLRRWTAPG